MRRRAAALIVALSSALAGVCWSAVPASATFPGHNGRIVFNRGQNIFTALPNGTGLRQLTTGGNSSYPKWNKGGTKIAFQRGAAVWTVNADGTGAKQLAVGHSPVFAPDGNSVYYVASGPSPNGCGGTNGIYRSPVTGGSRVRVVSLSYDCYSYPPIYGPLSVSPDGTRIVFMTDQESQYGVSEYSLVESTLATHSNRDLIDLTCGQNPQDPISTLCPGPDWMSNATYPDHTPNGTSLALGTDYTFNGVGTSGVPKLLLFNASTGAHRQVSNAAYVSYPSPSPDGTAIMFTQHLPGGSWQLDSTPSSASPSTAPHLVLANASQSDWAAVP